MPVVILISGNGSNLQAMIDGMNRGEIPIEIRAVISNRPGAYGLQRAAKAGIPALVVDHKQYADRVSFDRALRRTIDTHMPDLVILAGFMRILTPDLTEHYAGRMLNIHPSLLPEFTGLDTHARAIAAQRQEHGASIHFVTADLDGGPVIARSRVKIDDTDNAESLAAKVHAKEHILYPEVVRLYAEGRLSCKDDQVFLDHQRLDTPLDIS